MSIDPVSSYSSAYTSEIQSIPDDIICHIMSFVGVARLKAYARVSCRFLKLTIQETNITNIKIRKELSTFIGNMLLRLNEDTSAKQKTSLNEIKSSLNASFPNLVSLKQSILFIKKQIINLLETLDEEELNALEGTPSPGFWENIFEAAKICRRIPIARALGNATQKDESLQGIVRALVEVGEFDRAIEVANTIKWVVAKDESLLGIVRALVRTGKFDRAIEVANTIKWVVRKDGSLQGIVRALVRTNEFDRAIEVANTLENAIRKEESLQEIDRALKEASEIDTMI